MGGVRSSRCYYGMELNRMDLNGIRWDLYILTGHVVLYACERERGIGREEWVA